jgi:hypothetical protein
MNVKVFKFFIKEIKSVAHQLAISYSLNKTAKNPFSYHLCGYKNLIKEELEKMGSKSWHVNSFLFRLI